MNGEMLLGRVWVVVVRVFLRCGGGGEGEIVLGVKRLVMEVLSVFC